MLTARKRGGSAPEYLAQLCFTTPSGKLTFQGGITAGRGHQGDNAGETAVVSLLRGGAADDS